MVVGAAGVVLGQAWPRAGGRSQAPARPPALAGRRSCHIHGRCTTLTTLSPACWVAGRWQRARPQRRQGKGNLPAAPPSPPRTPVANDTPRLASKRLGVAIEDCVLARKTPRSRAPTAALAKHRVHDDKASPGPAQRGESAPPACSRNENPSGGATEPSRSGQRHSSQHDEHIVVQTRAGLRIGRRDRRRGNGPDRRLNIADQELDRSSLVLGSILSRDVPKTVSIRYVLLRNLVF